MFGTHEEAVKNGWFSRRHETDIQNRESGEFSRIKKIRKRMEAEKRQAERDQRSPEEQLAVLAARGVTTGREVDRLTGV